MSLQLVTKLGASRKLGHCALPNRRFLSQQTTKNFRPSNLQRRNAKLPVTSQAKSSKSGSEEFIGPYGLRRVDYSQAPPRWILPPPPPPSKNPIRRYFGVFMLASCTGLFVWIYFNQDESVYDYWRSVEQGDVPIDDDDDLDDEDLDLTNVDEWEDDNSQGKKT